MKKELKTNQYISKGHHSKLKDCLSFQKETIPKENLASSRNKFFLKRTIKTFSLFLVVNFSIYLNRRVFVMCWMNLLSGRANLSFKSSPILSRPGTKFSPLRAVPFEKAGKYLLVRMISLVGVSLHLRVYANSESRGQGPHCLSVEALVTRLTVQTKSYNLV